MSDSPLVDTGPLEQALQRFADERNWNGYHSPKNLAMALAGEVGELLEIFQWLTEPESAAVMRDAKTATAVEDELADVLMYLVRLASVLEVDLAKAVRNKLVKNAQKYPAPGG
ncbi:MAG TPA: nucleotide pyrophosphohydrolase [Ramlibacter sp.]|nr:nucleotide pyrophosphohydrolase [Ramlibacter sp.]